MASLQQVEVSSQPLERFIPLSGETAVRDAVRAAARLRSQLGGHRLWAVNSTRVGGGVAEMLRPLLAYARGTGIDVRWLVIDGDHDFFRITKRIHNALHGEPGDGSPLGPAERTQYERVSRQNSDALLDGARPSRGDIVLLHDPQTAGLAPPLARAGLHVVWRCHIGTELSNAETALGWQFLVPYLSAARGLVFSRAAYVPAAVGSMTTVIIPPSIDPFSAKNQELPGAVVRDVLAYTGIAGGGARSPVAFERPDGTRGEVSHAAEVMRLGCAPPPDVPLVVQVSRWDTLKDPLGVMQGFARLAAAGGAGDAELLLCGPNVLAVADDPDGARVFEQAVGAWRALPHAVRRRVALASLPVHDVDENAIIVNALQRHAAVVVQKSLREGFGLTVTEAMWKSRPVVASGVGGIVEQITDGVSGLLLDDPADLATFGALVGRVLSDRALAQRLGAQARERVREEFLGLRHLLQYAELFAHLLAG